MKQFFKNDLVTLYQGNCLQLLPQLEKNVNLVLADPPYQMINCKWDKIIDFNDMWSCLHNVILQHSPIVLFSSQPFTTDLICSNRKQFKYNLIWNKNVPTGMSVAKYRPMKYHQQILVFHSDSKSCYNPQMKQRIGKHKQCYKYNHYCGNSNHIKVQKVKKKYDPNFVQPSSVLNFNVVPNRNGKLHPTQKPVALLKYLLKTYSNENDVILDFCAGSGSLGQACMKTNRKCILIEQQEKYCNIIADRLNACQDFFKEI